MQLLASALALTLGVLSCGAVDNGKGLRPGMGWNSDYCTDCVRGDGQLGRLTGFENEAFIRHIADTLVSSGWAALGYVNVNMDSLWDLPKRDAAGDLQPDPALWPSGISASVAHVHALGLGFGVYGDRGTLDCNRNPGQLGHEVQDAAFYARMQFDWFKSDSCYASPDPGTAFHDYGVMRDALNKTGRQIWFALCGWEAWYAWKPPGGGGKTLGNSWRVGVDTGGGWGPVMSNVNAMLHGGPNGSTLAAYGGPGGWPDMCLLLNPGMGSGANLMTPARHRAQFGLHCIFNANVLTTGNLSALDPFTLATWGNAEAVDINQDTAHTFVVLPLESNEGVGAAFTFARVAECGGEPAAQAWAFDVPAAAFVFNNASQQCLNVDDCASAIIYDGCTTTGSTCAGTNKFNNEQFALSAAGALTSALPGARCVTVNADSSVSLAACATPLGTAQTWQHEAATGALVNGGGLCLTTTAAPPPPSALALLVGRELADGSWALLALNNAPTNATLVCGAACFAAMALPPGTPLHVRDVWAHADAPDATATALAIPLAASGTSAFLRISRAA